MLHIQPLLQTLLHALLLSTPGRAALPPDAVALLNQFPDKALTLSAVVGRAIGSSDSFRTVDSAKVATDSARLLSRSALDTTVTLSGSLTRDRSQYIIGFGTSDNLTEYGNLALAKAFSTGTTLSFEWNYQFNAPAYSSPLAAAFPTPYWEPKATLSLSQDLWQNAFGNALRAGLAAGELTAEASKLGHQDSIEGWFYDMVSVFYAAWLSQAQLRAAEGSLARKSKLVTLTQSRVSTGSSDESDALQARAGQASAQVQRNSSHQDLGDKWRGLVVSLKLPDAWLSIDPAEIPIRLDEVGPRAEQACQAPSPPAETAASRRAQLLADAARESLRKAESEHAPDFEIGLALGANAQSTQASTSLSDFFSLSHPRWMVTAKLKMPFEFSGERSRVQTAHAEALRAEAAASLSAGNLKLDWLNACLNFKQLTSSLEALRASFETQKRRMALDDRRFRLGRVSLFQVLATDDEATATESAFNATQVSTRLAAWKVLRLRGQLPQAIEQARTQGAALTF